MKYHQYQQMQRTRQHNDCELDLEFHLAHMNSYSYDHLHELLGSLRGVCQALCPAYPVASIPKWSRRSIPKRWHLLMCSMPELHSHVALVEEDRISHVPCSIEGEKQ
jgi:hypothetical protein